MRVLVTGAAGFIGSHVAEALLAGGHQVRGLDALPPTVHAAPPSYLPDCVELVVGDIRDAAVVANCLEGIDAVSHQAAMVGLGVDVGDLPAYADVNVTGTAVLLAGMAAAGVSRLVLASSMVVYGEGAYACPNDGAVRAAPRAIADLAAGRFEPRCPACDQVVTSKLVDESAALDPRNGYAATKVAQEHLAASWARSSDGKVIALRYHNVYGPRMPRDTPYSGVAAIFRSALERGQPPRVYEDGGQGRDFVHVRDVAQANVRALTALASDDAIPPGALRPYNVASGEPRTVGEMAAALAEAYGGPEPIVTGQYRLGDVRHIVASPDRATRELGFRAGIRFANGMAEFARAPLRG